MIKKYVYSSEVENILDNWKNLNKDDANSELKETTIVKVFSALYTFRTVVDLIDYEMLMQEENARDEVHEIEVEIGQGVVTLPTKVCTRPQLLFNEWNVLNDIHISTSEIKELEMKSLDILKLRVANYRGFINRIIGQSFILYKCD